MLEKAFFFIQSISKQYFLAYFAQKQRMEKSQIVQNHGLTPLQKFEFLALLVKDIFMLKKAYFFILSISKQYFSAYFAQKQIKVWKKFQFFYQNHGLTPLETSNFFSILKTHFCYPENLFFLSTISANNISRLFSPNKKVGKIFKIFYQNHSFWKNWNFFTF